MELQRKAAGPRERDTVPSIVHDVLRSSGQPLDPVTRGFMESRFGHDFSRVRVHTDAHAAESARAVNALAYTVGRDIVFEAGQYAPCTTTGRGLLAHELRHVLQQSNEFAASDLRVVAATSPLEHEAESAASRLQSPQGATETAGHRLGNPALLRQPAPGPTPAALGPSELSPWRRLFLESKEKILVKRVEVYCAGVRVLERLERHPPTPEEKVKRLEERREFIEHFTSMQREFDELIRKAKEGTLSDEEKKKLEVLALGLDVFEGLIQEELGGGSPEDWLARTDCELAQAQLEAVRAALGRPSPVGLLKPKPKP